MGYRTVVMLSNDHTHEWSKDPKLGEKIQAAMNNVGRDRYSNRSPRVDNYGEVVECVHADTVTVATLSFYTQFTPLGHDLWRQDRTKEEETIAALKDAADKMGFRLVRKTEKGN